MHLIESLVGIIPRSADLAKAFENGSDEDCLFVKRLAYMLLWYAVFVFLLICAGFCT